MELPNNKRDRSRIFINIRTNYNRLSKSQKQVADYVLLHSEEVLYLSISELAKRCEVSETTIVRFLKKIDYSSYQVFRVEIAQINNNEEQNFTTAEISSSDSTSILTDKVLSSTITALSDAKGIISDGEVDAFVKSILKAKRVLVFGVGSSYFIAGDLFHKLSRLGIRAVTESDDQMIAILSSHSTPDDTFILISHSGESSSILESAKFARKNGSKVCAMTSYTHSTLAENADNVLLSSSSETKYRPDAMLSRIIQMTIVDIISVNIILRTGDSAIKAIKKSQMAVAQHKR